MIKSLIYNQRQFSSSNLLSIWKIIDKYGFYNVTRTIIKTGLSTAISNNWNDVTKIKQYTTEDILQFSLIDVWKTKDNNIAFAYYDSLGKILVHKSVLVILMSDDLSEFIGLYTSNI